MQPHEEFSKAFRYQVQTLGNGILGLEMLSDYCRRDSRRGILYRAKRECRLLLEKIPFDRLSPSLLDQLYDLSLLDAESHHQLDKKSTQATVQHASNAVVALFIDRQLPLSGLVRTLYLEPVQPYSQARGFPAEADQDFRQALRDGCEAAKQLLEDVGVFPLFYIPEDYTFHVEYGAFGPNPSLHGRSAWLAAALSYFSLWSGLPTHGRLAATGSLAPHRDIVQLDGVSEKLTACLRERPEVTQIIVLSPQSLPAPYDADERVVPVQNLAQAVAAVWGPDWKAQVVPPAFNVYAALDKALHTYDKEQDYQNALKRFSLLRQFFAQAPQFPPRYRFVCDWRMASCHTHLGSDAEAGALFERWVPILETLWQQDELSTEDYVNFFASYGVYLQDNFAFSTAVAVLENVIAQTRDIRVHKLQRAKLSGTFGQVLMFHHQFPRAEQALLDAYGLIEDEEKPRECTYLGQLYILWRRYDEALHWLDEGVRLNLQLSIPRKQRGNAIFNGVWRARLLYERGAYAAAREAAATVLALKPDVYPGCLALKWKGLAHLANREHETGLALLQESYTLSPADRSPSTHVIQETARIEFLKYILKQQQAYPENIPFHVSSLLKTLDAFPPVRFHLAQELSQLQRYAHDDLPDVQLLNTLQQMTTKLVY